MPAGVAAKPFRIYGWQSYTWPVGWPPVNPSVWSSVSLGPESGPAAPNMAVTLTANYDGTVSVVYGTRPGAYSGSTPPVAVKAGVSTKIRITGLKYSTTIYANPLWNGVTPAGVPMQSQYGELSAATPSDPSLTVPPNLVAPQSADTSGGGGGCDFVIGTDVPCTGFIDYGPTTAYGTSTAFTGGDGTSGGGRLTLSITGLTPGNTYHWRARVTGKSPPNNVQTIGPDHTVVAA